MSTVTVTAAEVNKLRQETGAGRTGAPKRRVPNAGGGGRRPAGK